MVDTAISPYFDDYNAKKNYHKVLFTPRRAVQVRELNQMQSMLQEQINRFGDHVFENGSMVMPGEINHNLNYEYVTLDQVQYGSIVEILNTNEVKLTGATSGVVARLVQHVGNTATDPVTFYIRYQSSNESASPRFIDDEFIQMSTDLGVDFSTAQVTSSGVGSVLTIEPGIFYINGNFIRSDSSRNLLSKYSSTPSCVAGFRLIEEAVSWTDDPTLVDNASGVSNANAIGADRLRMTLKLEIHDIDSTFNQEDFIELVKFREGVLLEKARGVDYNVLEDTLARRTYDESGDYTVNSFNTLIREHLKTSDTSNGVYTVEQGGDESKFVVGVEPGKAYVRGYEIESVSTRYISVDKARSTNSINNSAFSLPVGNLIVISDLNILPKTSSYQTVTFYSDVPASAGAIPDGTVLGYADVRFVEYDEANSQALLYVFNIRNALSVNDTSFISTAKSVYAAGSPAFTALVESELIDTINASMVYKLPVDNVKSLLDLGVSDTSLTVLRQVVATADTSGTVILAAGADEVFASPTIQNSRASYSVGGVDTIREIASISTMGGAPTGKALTIEFGAGVASTPVTINLEVIKQTAIQKSKTPTTITITKQVGDLVDRKFSLNKADAYQIVSVIEGGVDKTSSYKLVKNATPEFYGVSSIRLGASESVPTQEVSITFKFFMHSTGDFFSVDSYSQVAYEDIPTEVINGVEVNLSDALDFRPRVNDAGTGYTGTGGSLTESPSPYSLVRCDIEHYLPRIDKVYVSYKGEFGVVKGVPSLKPSEPSTPDSAMVIYKLDVPAYTKNVNDIRQVSVNNRRYTMRDIGNLETRISNLEYYTTLSMLESETDSLQVIDAVTGLNRFKNGFITDNFIDHSVGSYTLPEYRCAVSMEDKLLRPEFNVEQVDMKFSDSLSLNVQLTGSLVTLPYSETLFISQDLASDYMNVNPYAVYRWNGTIELTPNSDTWFDNVYTEPEVTNRVFNNGRLTQQWNSWGLNWTGGTSTSNVWNLGGTNKFSTTGQFADWSHSRVGSIRTTTTTTTIDVVGDRVIDTSVIPYMRSRDVEFSAKGLMPESQVYAFFDDVNVTQYCKQSGKDFGTTMYADSKGGINGTFRIPNTDTTRFRTGTKRFTLIDNTDNKRETALSYGDTNYTAKGTLLTRTQSIIATQSTTTSVRPWDPLAQSFFVEKENGVFVTSVEVFFASKDEVAPVTMEIRNMVNGYPGQEVVPYSQVVVNPSEVNVSSDATVATKFVFPSPVYLVDGNEYCYVILSNSNNYNVYVATMGNKQINSNAYISKQPFVGVLFKSQNNTTWSADQTSDMKFKINVAKFVTNTQGTAKFVNDMLSDITLTNNPLTSVSGSSAISVHLDNHNLFVGSLVTLGGVVLAPGIDVAELNKTHIVESIIDADNFTIVVDSNAIATGTFGGASVTSEHAMIMNTIQPVTQELLLENTNVDWTMRGTTGMTAGGTEVPYLASGEFLITPNENSDLSAPLVVPTKSDITSKLFSSDATVMSANMITYVDNVSPAVDINRCGLIGVVNRVNKPATLQELSANGGNASARYITQVVGLKNAAESLKVIVDVNMPQGSNVYLYLRTGSSNIEVEGKDWSQMTTSTTSVATDSTAFAEFEYNKEGLPQFTHYQFKVVMTAESSSNVPKLKRFRGIALGS